MVFPLVLFSSSAFLHTVLRMGRRGNSQIRRRENHVSAPHSSRSCFRERWTLATAGDRPSVRLSDHYLSYAADLARTPPPRLAPGCVVQQTWMTYVMRSAPRQVGEGRREEERSRLCIGWRRGGGGGRGYSQSDVLPNAGILACRGRSRGPPKQPQGTLSERGRTHLSKGQGSPGSPKNPRAPGLCTW